MVCDVGKRYGGMKRVEKWKKERIGEVGDDKMKENENIFKEISFKILLFIWKSVSLRTEYYNS